MVISDPGCYHPHSLLSTTHTLLPPSITRPPAQSSNPDIPTNSPFLPPSTQQPAEESFAQGWGKVGKQVGAVGNVLFSAGGVGGGVYWLGGHGHRWTHTKVRPSHSSCTLCSPCSRTDPCFSCCSGWGGNHTQSVLLALFAFVAVAAVEIALYAIHFSRAESARKVDELAKARWDRGGLTVVGKGIERVEVPFVQESEGGQEEEGEVVEMKEEVKKVELRRRPLQGRQNEEINQR